MEANHEKKSFKKLLDRLQEDSWQLELLVSAFAIFGLFYCIEPIEKKLYVAVFDNNTVFSNFFIVVRFSLQILIFNLLLHVLLRGMWIGSLGLRYVFGEINFDKLNYSEFFTKRLKRKVGSFDAYINNLENSCSVIFAITFLLVFYIFSFFIICFLLLAFQNAVPEWAIPIVRSLFFLISLGAVLTFIDFVTLGLLKKNKWVTKVYFPFYWVFSLLTLSFLYRPLVYNLQDNKYGKRISLILIPFYLLVYVAFNLHFQKSNFITNETIKQSSNNVSVGRNYEDHVEKHDMVFMGDFVIQSKVISESYLKIFVPLNTAIEDSLACFNPNLKPEQDKRGLRFQSSISFNFDFGGEKAIPKSHVEEYLNTFERRYSFEIDNIPYKTNFVVTNMSGKLGFESFISIKNLTEGKHMITFKSLNQKGTNSFTNIRSVPFWHYKD